MGIKLSNNAFGTLAAGINSSATSITVASGQGARFPVLGAGDYFYATLINTSNQLEIVKCTARSADVLTVVRAQEATTARAYDVGDRIEIRITAQTFVDATSNVENLNAGNIEYTGTLTGGTGVINIGSGQLFKDASGNFGVQTSSPRSRADVNGILTVGDGNVPTLNLYRNVLLLTESGMGHVNFGGRFDGSNYSFGARIEGVSVGNWSSSSRGGQLRFSTVPNGSTTPIERVRIEDDGSQRSVIPGGSTLYPEFKCRAWVNFNASGSIRASGNVSSVTRNSTATYTVNFATAMPDANYAATGMCANGNNMVSIDSGVAQPSTTSIRVQNYDAGNTLQETDHVHIAVFR